MFFKGVRVKTNSLVVLKNITPITIDMEAYLSNVPSSGYKDVNKVMVQLGCNETEAQVSLLFIMLTHAKHIVALHDDVTEFSELQEKLAKTITETGTTNMHLSIDRVVHCIAHYLGSLVDGRNMPEQAAQEAMDILTKHAIANLR